MEHVAMEDAVARRSDHREGLALVERDVTFRRHETGAKTNARPVTFPDRTETEDEADRSDGHVGLVGVCHHARIADRGRLERVFVRE